MIRVLLDEDLDVRFRFELGPAYHVETVRYRGWKGKKNGALLALASGEFDVLVSGDSNLPFQQNIARFGLGVVVVRPHDKSLPNLLALLPELRDAISTVGRGQILEVGPLASGPP
jgi:hypothetical protein